MSARTSSRAEDDGAYPVFLALGSNIDPSANLPRAVRLLVQRFRVTRVSRIYESPPVGSPAGPPFLNAALLFTTEVPPGPLKLDHLRPIEAQLGRVRTADRNAPRTIDLDIALYGDWVVNDPEAGLTLPDPEILTCAHVALPLADLAPHHRHPVDGRTLEEIARQFAGSPHILVRDGLQSLLTPA